MSSQSEDPTTPAIVRPRLGLNPTTPHADAGMRIEPPPSFPYASGT